MIYLIDKSRNYARHLFLCVVSFVFLGSLFSCGNEENRIDPFRPLATDDASLLKWQMEKFIRTRAASYIAVIVTTNADFKFNELSFKNAVYKVDWGDGNVESQAISHTYTDGEPAHTIYIYADAASIERLAIPSQGVIYVDVSRCLKLKALDVSYNRLINLDITGNTQLESLDLVSNKLRDIDLSANVVMFALNISGNPIDSIDIRELPYLGMLQIANTDLTVLDVTKNFNLSVLNIAQTNISNLDVTHNLSLESIWLDKTSIEEIDFSKNSYLSSFSALDSELKGIDFSENSQIASITVRGSKVEYIKLKQPNQMWFLDIRDAPIEQNLGNMFSLLGNLPDYSTSSSPISPRIFTHSVYMDSFKGLLEDRSWTILQE